MEEKYKKFKEYNWVESEAWQAYYRNIFPTPPPSKILRYKKKFYRNKIDPDFDIDYKSPSEEESNQNSGGSSYSSNTNNNSNNYNQNTYTNQQTFETYKASQYLANPINSTLLVFVETAFIILFMLSLIFRYKTLLFGLIAFLIRTIRLVGIPQFNTNYLQAFIMNDSCHTLTFILQTLPDRLNYYMLLPSVISAVISLCDNIKLLNINIPIFKNYVDLINNKKEEIIQSRAHIEVAIGFISILGIFFKINSILTPIIYWQLMRVRYTINPYTKQSFVDLNNLATQFKNNEKCPGLIKFVIEKIQWAFELMGKMGTEQPEQNQNNNKQGLGSMCNII